jgi:pre-mRNA-splicing factor SPF27
LKVLKKEIQEVNWARKNQQTLVGERLRQLESQWVGLVSKNYEIEQVLTSSTVN